MSCPIGACKLPGSGQAGPFLFGKGIVPGVCSTERPVFIEVEKTGGYLAGREQPVYRYDFAEVPATHIDVFCDTDFAGCAVTRRSTSGGCALIGTGMVKHWSKTQTTIALSSGEADLGGISSGMAQAIALCSLAADMNWSLRPEFIQMQLHP